MGFLLNPKSHFSDPMILGTKKLFSCGIPKSYEISNYYRFRRRGRNGIGFWNFSDFWRKNTKKSQIFWLFDMGFGFFFVRWEKTPFHNLLMKTWHICAILAALVYSENSDAFEMLRENEGDAAGFLGELCAQTRYTVGLVTKCFSETLRLVTH